MFLYLLETYLMRSLDLGLIIEDDESGGGSPLYVLSKLFDSTKLEALPDLLRQCRTSLLESIEI